MVLDAFSGHGARQASATGMIWPGGVYAANTVAAGKDLVDEYGLTGKDISRA